MIKTHKEMQTKEVVVVDAIICNNCSQEIEGQYDYEGIIEKNITFGYGSRHFGDMTQIQFSLCELCLFKIVKGMQISPYVDDGSEFEVDELPQPEIEDDFMMKL
jgi:hypothetical protein